MATHRIVAILVRVQPSSAIRVRSVRVLRVVQTLVVRLPRLDRAVGDGLAFDIEHSALAVHVLALALRRDRVAMRELR